MSDKLEKRLAGLGLPDDLAETALHEEPAPSADAVRRIKERTLAQVTGPEPKSRPQPPTRRKAPWPLVAAAAAILLVVGFIGPARVMAGVQQLLAYVPGFGLRERATVQLAAPQPVRLQRGENRVEVLGLLADERSVTVHFLVQGIGLTADRVSLEDEQGRPLTPGPSSHAGSFDRWDAWYSFSGEVAPDTRAFTLVIREEEEWRVTVPVVAGAGLSTLEQFGPTVTARGFAVAAQLAAEGDRTTVTLLARSDNPEARAIGVGRYFGDLPATELPVLAAGDRLFPLLEGFGSHGQLRRFETDRLPAGTDRVSLTIPGLEVTEPGSARIALPLGAGPVDRQLTLGRWPLTLTRTEIHDGQLRVYVDPGPEEATSLARFARLEVNGKPASWHSRHSEQTGRMEYFEFALPQKGKRVTLTLSDPQIYVRGPWSFDLPVQP